MSVSLVSSSSSTQFAQRPQGPGKEIREGISALKKAVESGDLSSVQTAYDSLSKLQSSKDGNASSSTSSTSSASDSKNPLTKLLNSVGEALKSGDISTVQEAFSKNGPPSGGPGGAGGPPPNGPPPGDGGGSSDVRDAVGSLAQSLQSGDVSGAQDSLTSLTKLLASQSEDDDSNGETDSDSSSSSSRTSKSTGNSFLDKLTSSLSDISTALKSGDTASAQKLFASIAPRGSQGVNVIA
jgi:hypothetical protein